VACEFWSFTGGLSNKSTGAQSATTVQAIMGSKNTQQNTQCAREAVTTSIDLINRELIDIYLMTRTRKSHLNEYST